MVLCFVGIVYTVFRNKTPTHVFDYNFGVSLSNVSGCFFLNTVYIPVHSFVTKMAHHIKVKAEDQQSSSSSSSSPAKSSAAAAAVNDDDDEESLIVQLCPQFVWSVRDFTLELDLDGKHATPDEYLERCLQEKPGID